MSRDFCKERRTEVLKFSFSHTLDLAKFFQRSWRILCDLLQNGIVKNDEGGNASFLSDTFPQPSKTFKQAWIRCPGFSGNNSDFFLSFFFFCSRSGGERNWRPFSQDSHSLLR